MNPRKIALTIVRFSGISLFCLFGTEVVPVARGQSSSPTPTPIPTPTPNCNPTPTPDPIHATLPPCTECNTLGDEWPAPYVELPNTYQPTYGPRLAWIIKTPSGGFTPPIPGVLMIHGTSWWGGSAMQIDDKAQEVADAGYYVVVGEYELAPCGYIIGQPCHDQDDILVATAGDMVTRQTNDIKAYVRALRADPNVYPKKIGVVGGSAGGSHALSVAIDKTPSPGGLWPKWCLNDADDRPDCAVMLSGVYDFSDLTPVPGETETNQTFLKGTQNYVKDWHLPVLRAKSPIALVKTENTPFKPLFMINTYYDSPPSYHQIVDMICALQAYPETEYKTFTLMNSDAHSYHYWNYPLWTPATTQTPRIKGEVITFLDAHLKP